MSIPTETVTMNDSRTQKNPVALRPNYGSSTFMP
jgi:hypothetical protein